MSNEYLQRFIEKKDGGKDNKISAEILAVTNPEYSSFCISECQYDKILDHWWCEGDIDDDDGNIL